MKISLRPIGNIDSDIIEELKGEVKDVFGCPVEIKLRIDGLEQAYDAKRKQYLAPVLISLINSVEKERDERVVGIADVDLYAPRLNFVFGEADVLSGIAVVSLCRLKQEYYGLPPDKALFIKRATKEIVHELGHSFGLRHCPDAKCIMHFSNSLADTDYKEVNFCNKCCPRLAWVI